MSVNELINIFTPADSSILSLEWYVSSHDNIFSTFSSDTFNFNIIISDLGIDDFVVIPNEYNLLNPYPNPFNPITMIKYTVPELGQISISIYDIRGREVEKLYNGSQTPGYHMIPWNASEYSSGIYFVRMLTGKYVYNKKLMLVK